MICAMHRRLYDWGYTPYPPSYKHLEIVQFSTSVFSTQVEPDLTKRRTITKQEVVFHVLVLISRSV